MCKAQSLKLYLLRDKVVALLVIVGYKWAAERFLHRKPRLRQIGVADFPRKINSEDAKGGLGGTDKRQEHALGNLFDEFGELIHDFDSSFALIVDLPEGEYFDI